MTNRPVRHPSPPLPLPPSPAPPSRTRVLFVLGSFGGGGAERQTIDWLRHLDRGRYEPVLYVISRAGPLARECPDDVPVFCYEDRVQPPSVYIPGRAYRRQVRHLRRVIDEVRPDRLVTVSLLMTLLAAGLPWPWQRWFAVEMADPRLDFADQVTRFRRTKWSRLRRAYCRAMPVAISEGVREGLVEYYGIPAESIRVIPNVIDVARVDAQAAEPGPELEEDRFHIVTVGRLQPQKGQSDLLEALRILVRERGYDSSCLHLVGEGPLRGQLESLVATHALESHVILHGFRANPLALVVRCDLFCFPSIYEGLGLALAEAMTCGTPVIATDCPSGPREVLADGKFGDLVPVHNPQAMADAIEQVINNRSMAQARAEQARQHVIENYSIAVAMARWESLLA